MEVGSFDAARITAIKVYSNLEYELALLFQIIIGVDASIAWAIFYQITNTRAKYAIITNTLQIKHGHTYKKGWGIIERWLEQVDTKRNHLVHWEENSVTRVTINRNTREARYDAIPHLSNAVHRYSSNIDSRRYRVSDINDFIKRVDVLRHIVSCFAQTISTPEASAWTKIFQAPLDWRDPAKLLQHLNDLSRDFTRDI